MWIFLIILLAVTHFKIWSFERAKYSINIPAKREREKATGLGCADKIPQNGFIFSLDYKNTHNRCTRLTYKATVAVAVAAPAPAATWTWSYYNINRLCHLMKYQAPEEFWMRACESAVNRLWCGKNISLIDFPERIF